MNTRHSLGHDKEFLEFVTNTQHTLFTCSWWNGFGSYSCVTLHFLSHGDVVPQLHPSSSVKTLEQCIFKVVFIRWPSVRSFGLGLILWEFSTTPVNGQKNPLQFWINSFLRPHNFICTGHNHVTFSGVKNTTFELQMSTQIHVASAPVGST